MTKKLRWLLGAIVLGGIVALIVGRTMPILFFQDLPHVAFIVRCLFVLLLCSFLCLYRILRGPTAPDRVVAIDILGILVVGFCAVLGISTGRSWYMDIGIAWGLQIFVATIALAKYIEGKGLEK